MGLIKKNSDNTESKRLLTIKTDDGYSESIVVPNDNEATIKKAINKIHTENYIDSHCVDWRYNDGCGSYFDQVMKHKIFKLVIT